jgi:hypothetical protein
VAASCRLLPVPMMREHCAYQRPRKETKHLKIDGNVCLSSAHVWNLSLIRISHSEYCGVCEHTYQSCEKHYNDCTGDDGCMDWIQRYTWKCELTCMNVKTYWY